MSTSHFSTPDYRRRFDSRCIEENLFALLALRSSASARLALRAKICWEFQDCGSVSQTASELRTTIKTVERTLDRFVRYGLVGLKTPSLPHGRSTKRLPERVERKLFALIRSGVRKVRAKGPKRSARSLARKLGISPMSVSRIRHKFGFDKKSLRQKRTELASNTCYIVGFSVHKAMVFGVRKNERIQPAVVGDLSESLRLSLDRRFGEQLRQFDNAYSPPRREYRDFLRFIHHVDAKTHPEMTLYVVCRKELRRYLPALKRSSLTTRPIDCPPTQSSPSREPQSPMKPSIFAQVPSIYLSFCPGRNWSYFVLQHLAYARQHHFTIRNWDDVAHCMKINLPAGLHPVRNLVCTRTVGRS